MNVSLRPTVFPAAQALGSLSSVALSSLAALLRYHGKAATGGDIFNELTKGTFSSSRDT
jgi:hypothetical protein